MATGNTPQAVIDDIETSRDNIAQSIRNKGVSVPNDAKLSDLSAKVSSIVTPNLQSKSATPSESAQTIKPDTNSGYNGLSQVTVGAISKTYVGSGVAKKSSSDLTASGKTVTVPAGYYASNATKDVSSGSATTPATTITKTPTISVNSSGVITASVSGTQSVAPTVTPGYVSSGTAGTITVSGSATKQLTVQPAKTVTPTTSEQTAVASGVYTTGAVKVAAVKLQSKRATPSGEQQIIKPDSGYNGLDQVTVESIPEVERAETEIDVEAFGNVISVLASNNQEEGYVTGSNETRQLRLQLSVDEPTIDGNGDVTATATVEGTVADREGEVSVTVTSETTTIPRASFTTSGNVVKTTSTGAGYIPANTTVGTVAEGVLPDPYMQINAKTGVVSAYVDIAEFGTAGYISDDTPAAYSEIQLSTQAAKTITPSRSSQTAVASGKYTTGAVTVKGDTNLLASNIKKDVTIFGVKGSYEGSGDNIRPSSKSNTIVTITDYTGRELEMDCLVYSGGTLTKHETYCGYFDSMVFEIAEGTMIKIECSEASVSLTWVDIWGDGERYQGWTGGMHMFDGNYGYFIVPFGFDGEYELDIEIYD